MTLFWKETSLPRIRYANVNVLYEGPICALMRQIARLQIIWDGRRRIFNVTPSLPLSSLAFSAYASILHPAWGACTYDACIGEGAAPKADI